MRVIAHEDGGSAELLRFIREQREELNRACGVPWEILQGREIYRQRGIEVARTRLHVPSHHAHRLSVDLAIPAGTSWITGWDMATPTEPERIEFRVWQQAVPAAHPIPSLSDQIWQQLRDHYGVDRGRPSGFFDAGQGGLIRHESELAMNAECRGHRLDRIRMRWPKDAAPRTWQTMGRVFQWGYASEEEAAAARRAFLADKSVGVPAGEA